MDPKNLSVNINVVNPAMAVSRAAARRSLLTAAAAATRSHTHNARTKPMVRNLTVADTASGSRTENRKPTAPVTATEEIMGDTKGSVTRNVAGIGLTGIWTIITGALEVVNGGTATGVRKGLGTKRKGPGTARRDSAKVIRLRMMAVATEARAASMVTRVDMAVVKVKVKVKVDMASPSVSRNFPSAKRDVTMVTTRTTTATMRTLIS